MMSSARPGVTAQPRRNKHLFGTKGRPQVRTDAGVCEADAARSRLDAARSCGCKPGGQFGGGARRRQDRHLARADSATALHTRCRSKGSTQVRGSAYPGPDLHSDRLGPNIWPYPQAGVPPTSRSASTRWSGSVFRGSTIPNIVHRQDDLGGQHSAALRMMHGPNVFARCQARCYTKWCTAHSR